MNLLLYHGVLAPRAAWRSAIVPTVPAAGASGDRGDGTGDERPEPAARRNYRWAELMRRTFGVDVLACPGCGGRLRLIALIDQPAVIARVLAHLGLPTSVPVAARAAPALVDDPELF